MRIHHLNCATMCPPGGRLMDGRTGARHRATLICHCLLIETDRDGLVLVDTGLGTGDVHHPQPRLSFAFENLMRLPLRESETAVRQIEKRGFRATDVRHIVLTHLDFDHAGGLGDFPEATVHLLAAERAVAESARTWLDRQRFRHAQWGDRKNWQTHVPSGEHWFGFECVRAIEELSAEILLVPLPGHTMGHAGVAVAHSGGWLLHCGDAYFFHAEMDLDMPRCTPGLDVYQRLMEQDRGLRLENQARLRELARDHGSKVELFCAHDLSEYEHMQTRSVERTGLSASEAALTHQHDVRS